MALLRDWNVIFVLSVLDGLLRGEGAPWTRQAALPVVAVIMTLSLIGMELGLAVKGDSHDKD